MSWKDFLKPTWVKVLLFLLLFLFFPILFLWLEKACMKTEVYNPNTPPCEFQWRISIGWIPSAIINELERTWTAEPFDINSLPAMWYPFYYIYHLFFVYFLSCLIVWIYNKVRKK